MGDAHWAFAAVGRGGVVEPGVGAGGAGWDGAEVRRCPRDGVDLTPWP